MTALTDSLYEAYAYDAEDTAKISRQLTERRRAAWINELSALAAKHGCSQLAGTPKGQDAKFLATISQTDADSITNTYNRELRNQIERLYQRNKRGNRTYYTSNLAKWQAARDVWKNYQIALQTDTTARQYAFSRFYAMNQIAQAFVAGGPPPTCKICIRLFAVGVVDYAYTQQHGFPAHVNCPHSWRTVAPVKVECSKLWLG